MKIIDDRGIESLKIIGLAMMERKSIDRLIINSPYEEPQRHWRYNREAPHALPS